MPRPPQLESNFSPRFGSREQASQRERGEHDFPILGLRFVELFFGLARHSGCEQCKKFSRPETALGWTNVPLLTMERKRLDKVTRENN